jgi:hypothetical protein
MIFCPSFSLSFSFFLLLSLFLAHMHASRDGEHTRYADALVQDNSGSLWHQLHHPLEGGHAPL